MYIYIYDDIWCRTFWQASGAGRAARALVIQEQHGDSSLTNQTQKCSKRGVRGKRLGRGHQKLISPEGSGFQRSTCVL